MAFDYFSRNGEVLPIGEATVALSNIEYQYGFGVYETIRVASGAPRFLVEHLERLMESARLIGLEHAFTFAFIEKAIAELVEKNAAETCNLKILLIGGEPLLAILCLNPLFPDKTLYRDGAHCTLYEYERALPHAKSLNMLQSYLAYREARKEGAYDALLVDRHGTIREGTRTNFFCIKGKTIVSPPEEKILLGVTRAHVLEAALRGGFSIDESDIQSSDISLYDGAFLTSTSTKIMPVRSIGAHAFAPPPEALRELMAAFDAFLDQLF